MAHNARGARAREAADLSIAPMAHDVPTAARMIGIGQSLCWQLIRDGKIRVTRIGRRTLVPVTEVARVVIEGC